jgi:cell division protein FtsL
MQRLRQTLATLLVLGAVVAAVALYAIKQQTRVVAATVTQLERAVAQQEVEMVVLKAELANLTRPDRIARLARTHLGMKPISPAQLGRIADLPWREGVVAAKASTAVSP